MTNLAQILIASQVINDSGVTGATVKAALDTLLAAGGSSSYYGTFAGKPAAGTAGKLGFFTDAPVSTWVDDGAAWRPIVNGVICTAPPLVSAMTWFNQGGAVATQLNGAIGMVGVNDGASPGAQRGLFITNAAATAYGEIGISFAPQSDQVAGHTVSTSCMLREAATGKIYNLNTFQNLNALNSAIEIEVWTSSTARSVATAKGYLAWDSNQPVFTRVRRSGANVVAEVSRDRQVWTQYDSRGAAGVFTTAPDQVGFCCSGVNSVPAFNVLHFINGS